MNPPWCVSVDHNARTLCVTHHLPVMFHLPEHRLDRGHPGQTALHIRFTAGRHLILQNSVIFITGTAVTQPKPTRQIFSSGIETNLKRQARWRTLPLTGKGFHFERPPPPQKHLFKLVPGSNTLGTRGASRSPDLASELPLVPRIRK